MRRCLIVIDTQNDFVSGSLGTDAARAVESAIAQQISDRRAQGYDIILTLDTHDDGYLMTTEGRNLPVAHCVKGTQGHALTDKVASAVKDDDTIIEKPIFGSVELFDLLRAEPYEEIELIGLVTDICVIANAVLAKTACPEAIVHVNAALTAGTTPQKHQAALDVMRSLQIDVTGD